MAMSSPPMQRCTGLGNQQALAGALQGVNGASSLQTHPLNVNARDPFMESLWSVPTLMKIDRSSWFTVTGSSAFGHIPGRIRNHHETSNNIDRRGEGGGRGFEHVCGILVRYPRGGRWKMCMNLVLFKPGRVRVVSSQRSLFSGLGPGSESLSTTLRTTRQTNNDDTAVLPSVLFQAVPCGFNA